MGLSLAAPRLRPARAADLGNLPPPVLEVRSVLAPNLALAPRPSWVLVEREASLARAGLEDLRGFQARPGLPGSLPVLRHPTARVDEPALLSAPRPALLPARVAIPALVPGSRAVP